MDPPLSGWNPIPFENRLGSFCARISEEDKIINNTHFLALVSWDGMLRYISFSWECKLINAYVLWL